MGGLGESQIPQRSIALTENWLWLLEKPPPGGALRARKAIREAGETVLAIMEPDGISKASVYHALA
jgi:hypothetical protein